MKWISTTAELRAKANGVTEGVNPERCNDVIFQLSPCVYALIPLPIRYICKDV